jgi:MraZ protein
VGRAVVFTGTFDRQLDDKGRISLPSDYKTRFEGSCYVVKGANRCLEVFLTEDFEAEAARMHERRLAGEVGRGEERNMMASADLTKIDKQGRISLVEHLRKYAELAAPSQVVLTGNYDRMEIWDPARFAELRAANDETLASEGL